MDVRELKDQAAELFRKGKFGKAAEAYLQLVKLEPKEGQHLIKLGDSYRRDGQKEPAIDAYRRAVDDYAKQGIVIKAIAACKLILEIDPNQKDAQNALATLCAKRYVRRDDVDASQPLPKAMPAKRGAITEPIELPEDDELELETTSGAAMPSGKAAAKPPEKKPEPPKPAPRAEPPRPPPPRMAPEPVETIDLDFNEAPAPAPAPKRAAPPPPPPAAPEPAELELDLGLEVASSASPAPVTPPATSASRRRGDAYDLSELEESGEPADVLEGVLEEAEEELPPGVRRVTAENTDEHEVLQSAEKAAKRPATAMADILSDSLLIEGEGDDGEEIELVSVTSGAPAPAPAPAHAQADELANDDEQHEMVRLANEAAFDALTSADDELDPISEASLPPVPPPPPPADVEQQNVPLFSELPRDAFLELLERLHFRRFADGEVILREGDVGRSIFVVASGRAKVVKALGTPAQLELAKLDDGAFFGEMALLNGAPRVASVVADGDCEVLELTEELLRELTAKHPSVAQSLKKFYRQRLLSNVMAISPLFRAFDKGDRKMLVEKFKLREAKAEEAIIKEGEKPDGLYVIMHGAALVTKKAEGGGREMPLAVLKEGDVFGEMSLLSRKPATATVLAKRKTLVLRLPKSVFDELMFTHPAVLEVVSELTDQRSKVNEQILSGRVESPREALALL